MTLRSRQAKIKYFQNISKMNGTLNSVNLCHQWKFTRGSQAKRGHGSIDRLKG